MRSGATKSMGKGGTYYLINDAMRNGDQHGCSTLQQPQKFISGELGIFWNYKFRHSTIKIFLNLRERTKSSKKRMINLTKVNLKILYN